MSIKTKNKRRVKSAKRAYREFMKDPVRAELLRKARSKGGKNGSREDKVKAGQAGWTAMLESLAKKAGVPMGNQQPTVSVSQPQDPNSFSTNPGDGTNLTSNQTNK